MQRVIAPSPVPPTLDSPQAKIVAPRAPGSAWRRIPHLLLALILGLALISDAAVGIYQRATCTSIASPETGKTYCLEETTNVLKRWNGTAWELISVGGVQLPSSTLATLPPAGTAGRLARVIGTNHVYFDNGTAWIPIETLEAYTLAGLPAAGTAGRLARVTDVLPGVYYDTGIAWVRVNDTVTTTLPSSTLAGLPAVGTAGRLARVTDDNRGLRTDTSTIWSAKGRIFYAEDFDISPARTAAQNNTGFTNLLAALPATGATVILPPGTINFSAALLFNSKEINFIGAGREATVLLGTTGHDGINNASGSRIAHLTLRGPNVASVGNSGIDSGGVTDAVIEDVIIEQWGDHGINTGGTSLRWLIRGNIVRNNINDGILVASNSTDNIVEGNVITGNRANGIDVNGSRNIVRGNVVRQNGGVGGGVDQWGILLAAVTGANANFNLVAKNLVSDNGSQGIILKAVTAQTVNYNAIVGNIVVSNGEGGGNGDGITVDGSSAGTLTGNLIEANIVQGNERHGILVDGLVGTASQNMVRGNIADGNGNTGVITSGTDTTIAGNQAIGNTSAQITDIGTATLRYGNKTGTGAGNIAFQHVATTSVNTSPTYGATVSINASLGNSFEIGVTDANAFTVSSPTNGSDGQRITIRIKNVTAGALGAVTFGTAYKLSAWTQPGNSNSRAISFRFNGLNWVEEDRTTVDVPN